MNTGRIGFLKCDRKEEGNSNQGDGESRMSDLDINSSQWQELIWKIQHSG